MAKNYIQAGDHLTIPAPAATVSGAPVLAGALFGVAEHDAATGADLTIARKGVFTLAKTAAQAWTVGAKLYWDATAGSVTTTVGTNVLIGAAAAAAIAADTSGQVMLDGTIR